MRGVLCLHDLDVRFQVMGQFARYDYVQVLSLPPPPIELEPEARAKIKHKNAERLFGPRPH